MRREICEKLLECFGRFTDIDLLGADDPLLVLHPLPEILALSVVVEQLERILNKVAPFGNKEVAQFYFKPLSLHLVFKDEVPFCVEASRAPIL